MTISTQIMNAVNIEGRSRRCGIPRPGTLPIALLN
jgi:hypothetical protein